MTPHGHIHETIKKKIIFVLKDSCNSDEYVFYSISQFKCGHKLVITINTKKNSCATTMTAFNLCISWNTHSRLCFYALEIEKCKLLIGKCHTNIFLQAIKHWEDSRQRIHCTMSKKKYKEKKSPTDTFFTFFIVYQNLKM